MTIAVSASVATDHLMSFSGRFSDDLVADRLEKISVSYLVDSLDIRRGGVGGNICFALGVLGERPLLLAAVGEDCQDYRQWLEDHGVDCSHLHVSSTAGTARFTCTTDAVQAQFASFYPGALSESDQISLHDLPTRPDLVLVGASAPAAMVKHTAEARELGIPFAADPSQQLPMMDGETLRSLICGAEYLFSNDYELSLIQQKTGYSVAELEEQVNVRVTTLGSDGVEIHADGTTITVPAIPARQEVDPTGAGDAFRSGFLAGRRQGLSWKHAAQLGALIAVYVVETMGTQEWTWDTAEAKERLAAAYSQEDADTILSALDV